MYQTPAQTQSFAGYQSSAQSPYASNDYSSPQGSAVQASVKKSSHSMLNGKISYICVLFIVIGRNPRDSCNLIGCGSRHFFFGDIWPQSRNPKWQNHLCSLSFSFIIFHSLLPTSPNKRRLSWLFQRFTFISWSGISRRHQTFVYPRLHHKV